ncbi:oligosaccharide flippase family protein [Neobacillus ginsengisoli]|uniref:O-antigen/teichoic acid export membrane protein n=1 Tax=Neobacillus ginsengisoli TaxID=904295 RepID=A0ABT9XVV9_9BACI|nr:oligosaccharide flippase family protein [Neobacillus ginsengisoli]MDQ0199064.1 O-antigen/teichoic acid export membrane protein [Neobacillus ginsengisoli]
MKKSLFKNIIYKVLLNVFNLILPILVGPYVNRVLGAHSIGKVQFGETIYNYFLIFATFGVYQYGLREMSRIREDKQKVRQLFTSLYTISTVTGVTALLCYLVFTYFKFSTSTYYPILFIYAFNFICNIFYVEWVNEAMENYDFITIKTIIVRIIYVVLIFIFVRHVQDYQQYAMLLVLAMFLNNFISFVFIKRKIQFDFKNIRIKEHLKPMFLVVIFSNASVLYTLLDRYMLGNYLNSKAVSFYVIPQQIMGIINTLMLSVVQVTIPRLSNILGSNDEKSYMILLNNISKVFFSFLFPASIGIYILSDVAVFIYGGKGFLPAIPALSMFAFYMVVSGIDSIFANQIIYVKKKEHILVRLIFLCGIINLIFKIALLKLGWLTPRNAILTTTIANFLLILLEYGYIRRFLKVDYRLFDFSKLKYLVYALLFIPVSYGIRHFLSGPIPLFIGIVSVNSILYGLILIVTKDFVLQMLLGKIKARFGRT